MYYSGGILTVHACQGKRLDHAITAVGWGTDGVMDYLIVRNSWGTSWGEKGYIRMQITKNNGACGVLDDPAQPYTN